MVDMRSGLQLISVFANLSTLHIYKRIYSFVSIIKCSSWSNLTAISHVPIHAKFMEVDSKDLFDFADLKRKGW